MSAFEEIKLTVISTLTETINLILYGWRRRKRKFYKRKYVCWIQMIHYKYSSSDDIRETEEMKRIIYPFIIGI